jgi:hypothetical protein
MFRKLAGLTAVAGLFVAGTASAQILNTAHDLRGDITGLTEICIVCHAPHNNQNAQGDLLWNHDPTTQTFIPYASPTLNGASTGPGETSLLCMGCHDGIVALDAYGGRTPQEGPLTGGLAFGADLSNDHPVGIDYDPALDPELNATTTPVTFGDASTGTVADMLQAAKVECASCHDVHATLSGGSTGNGRLLLVDNAGSDLCFACHGK